VAPNSFRGASLWLASWGDWRYADPGPGLGQEPRGDRVQSFSVRPSRGFVEAARAWQDAMIVTTCVTEYLRVQTVKEVDYALLWYHYCKALSAQGWRKEIGH